MAADTPKEHEILSQETLWQGHFRVGGLTVRCSWSHPINREVFGRGHAVAAAGRRPRA